MTTWSNCLPLQTGRWKWILGLTFLWLAIITGIGNRHYTLCPGWADELSHLYTVPIFFQNGIDIYRRPTIELIQNADFHTRQEFSKTLDISTDDVFLNRAGDSMSIAWPTVPRPYPPGVYLELAIPGLLLQHHLISPGLAVLMVVFVTLLFAHLAFFLLADLIWPMAREAGRPAQGIAALSGLLMYAELIRWTLNSQYDPSAVFCLVAFIIAYRDRRFFFALFLFASALFLHLRSLFYFPLACFALYEWLISPGKRARHLTLKHWLVLILSCSMMLAAFLTFWWNEPYFRQANLYDLNALHFSKLGTGNWSKTIALFAGLVGVCAYWWRRQTFAACFCAVWTVYMLLQTRVLREWYILFLIPFFLLALPSAKCLREQPKRRLVFDLAVVLFFVTLMSSLFFNNSPFELRLVRDLATAVHTSP